MIPKVFHRAWFGPPMPVEFARHGDGWLAHHPDWELRSWTIDNLPSLVNQALFDHADEIVPRDADRFRADVARYDLLYQFGGVWLDADFECRRSLEPLLAGVSAFAAWEVDDRWVSNAIMGAVAGHPFVHHLVGALPRNVNRHQSARVTNPMTGPTYLTRIWRQHFGSVVIFPSRLFYPYLWNELDRMTEDFPDAYAVHHWHNRRKRLDGATRTR